MILGAKYANTDAGSRVGGAVDRKSETILIEMLQTVVAVVKSDMVAQLGVGDVLRRRVLQGRSDLCQMNAVDADAVIRQHNLTAILLAAAS